LVQRRDELLAEAAHGIATEYGYMTEARTGWLALEETLALIERLAADNVEPQRGKDARRGKTEPAGYAGAALLTLNRP